MGQGATHCDQRRGDCCQGRFGERGSRSILYLSKNLFAESVDSLYADLGYRDFIYPNRIKNFALTVPYAFDLHAQARCGIKYNATRNDIASMPPC
ncbi:hypothetical protein BAUCODRAFT_123334 [Baudoinia panamericana UAMH 10762]|uniref:Uncharacterized protein n=1 Tax=Baudoinia panamericana (strain UAMH 10762) TaxID=717646 RepID=M2NAA8_BAUPA|nr:uncharacterized protein BAUCODRAFT_123334 [Baudoinia panamericana UAMH 10762]EMC96059.1 hypothetical protein BAUCODRAFT_123334 [Baudoinia panamericana UAMH 10762]